VRDARLASALACVRRFDGLDLRQLRKVMARIQQIDLAAKHTCANMPGNALLKLLDSSNLPSP
jgi:hypothetical protein